MLEQNRTCDHDLMSTEPRYILNSLSNLAHLLLSPSLLWSSIWFDSLLSNQFNSFLLKINEITTVYKPMQEFQTYNTQSSLIFMK